MKQQSVCSIVLCICKTLLYGSTTELEMFGDGPIANWYLAGIHYYECERVIPDNLFEESRLKPDFIGYIMIHTLWPIGILDFDLPLPYSAAIFSMSRLVNPDPVPPPIE